MGYIALDRAPWNAETDISLPLALETQLDDGLTTPDLEGTLSPSDGS